MRVLLGFFVHMRRERELTEGKWNGRNERVRRVKMKQGDIWREGKLKVGKGAIL